MRVILGADHRGFVLKEHLKTWLQEQGYEVMDVGAMTYDKDDDYVDYAQQVVEQLTAQDRGVLLCGSGHGIDIVANRYPHIRSILGFNQAVTQQGREHEDANALCLPAEWLSQEQAKEIAQVFLNTPFSGKERYRRRLEKLQHLKPKTI